MKRVSNEVFESEVNKYNSLETKLDLKFEKKDLYEDKNWVCVEGIIPLEFADMLYAKREELRIIPDEYNTYCNILIINPREFIKHKSFDLAMISYQALYNGKTNAEVYKGFCEKVILKDYSGCYIDRCFFYSDEEFKFFIENLIEYIKSKTIVNKESDSKSLEIILNLK